GRRRPLRRLLDRRQVAAGGLPAGHARPRGARGDDGARHPGGQPDRARLRGADVPRAPAGHPRAADRALGGVEARRRLPAEPPRRAPGPPGDRRRGPARVQAHDHPRLRDPLEQLRLRLPGLPGPRARPRGAQGRRAGEVRLAAAPPLRRPGVRLERGAHARREREPRIRRVLPGLPDRRVDDDHHDRLQHRLEVAFRAALGDRLAALVAYGSAADGTFIAGFSDFDLAVFLRGEFSPDDAVAAQAALGDLDPAPFDYLQTKFIDLSLPPTPTLVPDSYLVFAGSLPSEPAYLYNDASLRRSGRKWLDDLPALIAADAAAWSVAAGSKRRRRLVRLMMTRLKPGLRAFLVERGESP